MSIQPNTYAHTSWVGNMTAAHADAIFTEFMPRGWVSNAAQESLPTTSLYSAERDFCVVVGKADYLWEIMYSKLRKGHARDTRRLRLVALEMIENNFEYLMLYVGGGSLNNCLQRYNFKQNWSSFLWSTTSSCNHLLSYHNPYVFVHTNRYQTTEKELSLSNANANDSSWTAENNILILYTSYQLETVLLLF